MKIIFNPIGVIRSPFKKNEGTPIQPAAAKGVIGKVIVFSEYTEGLRDLDGFSHIILLYHFHLAGKYALRVKPFLDNKERGLFATRAPSRPNPIGISVVRLVDVSGDELAVENLDILDNTPLLDIKPFVPEFRTDEKIEIGWLRDKTGYIKNTGDDGRFKHKDG